MYSFAEQKEELDLKTADLGEIDRALYNPLTSIWSLMFPNNTALKTGDAVDGSETSNALFFQRFKIQAEIHDSIIKPEGYGTEWNFRLQITPVINSPMKK